MREQAAGGTSPRPDPPSPAPARPRRVGPVPWTNWGALVREAGMDLARRKLNSPGNYRFMRLSNGVSRAREPGASVAPVLQGLCLRPQRDPDGSAPAALPSGASLRGEAARTQRKPANGGLKAPPAPQTESPFMPEFLLPPKPLRLRSAHPQHSAETSPQKVPAASRAGRARTRHEGRCPMHTLGAGSTGNGWGHGRGHGRGRVAASRGLAVAHGAAPLHQAAVRGNFCSSTMLPVSSLRANFNRRVAAVRVKNLTLL